MKKAAFSICSNNYLAKALVAAESFLDHHTDYHFHVILVDRFSDQLSYPTRPDISVTDVGSFVENIDELALKYNIIELNTAVKARAFIYLLDRFDYSWLIYLDPDVIITSKFIELEGLLRSQRCNVILTPHLSSPIDDGKKPSELDVLPYGIYNLGFIAIINSGESRRFLDWWHSRLMKYCYMLPTKGMFTDQLWINFAPLFFDSVHVLKNAGYNTANWNLYERKLTRKDGRYFVNQVHELRFFHFSHYKYDRPYIISYHQNRHDVHEIPALKELIDDYQARLTRNNQSSVQKIDCYFANAHRAHQQRGPIHLFLRHCRNTLRFFIGGLRRESADGK